MVERRSQTRRHAIKRVSLGDGPPCPSCGNITMAWRHGDDWVPTQGKTYFAFWYQCPERSCSTTLIMPPQGNVLADVPAGPAPARQAAAERHP